MHLNVCICMSEKTYKGQRRYSIPGAGFKGDWEPPHVGVGDTGSSITVASVTNS